MFRTDVKQVSEVLLYALRQQGLETPLLQRRLIDSWQDVVGAVIAQYTRNLYIRNQTLFVALTNPALRADLSMMRQQYVQRLNAAVGSQVICDIRFC